MFTTNLPSVSVPKNVWILLTGVLSTTGLLTKLVNIMIFLCPITGKLTSHFPQRDCKQGLFLLPGWQLAGNIQEMNTFRSSLWQFGQWIRQFCRCENVTDSNTHAFTHSVTAQVWPPYKRKLKTHQKYPSLPCEVNKDGLPQAATCTVRNPMAEKASSLNILFAYIFSTSWSFFASETWSSFDRIDENSTRVPMAFRTSISLLLSFLTCLGSFTTVSLVMTGMRCLSCSITLAGFSMLWRKHNSTPCLDPNGYLPKGTKLSAFRTAQKSSSSPWRNESIHLIHWLTVVSQVLLVLTHWASQRLI